MTPTEKHIALSVSKFLEDQGFENISVYLEERNLKECLPDMLSFDFEYSGVKVSSCYDRTIIADCAGESSKDLKSFLNNLLNELMGFYFEDRAAKKKLKPEP